MSGRAEWAEKKPVAFCRARFSYTGMEKGDLTFSRDEVLLACPLSLAAFVHRTNPAPAVGRERGGSGSGEATTVSATGSLGRGVRWVLAIHPDGECGRIPANYVTPLADEEVMQMMDRGTLGQLSSLFDDLRQEAAEERTSQPKRRGSELKNEKRHAPKSDATDSEENGEPETRVAKTTAATAPLPPSTDTKSRSDSQLQRLIQQKLKTFEDDVSGTLKFYHNMRRGVQSLFDAPPRNDE